jgi:hypothetical protein
MCPPALQQEHDLHLSDPGQVLALSLFADFFCSFIHSEIDRNCSRLSVSSQLLFCFHFSIVKVLTSPSGARFTNDIEQVVHSLAVAQVVCHIFNILSRGLLISFYPVKKLVFPALFYYREQSAQPAIRSEYSHTHNAHGRNKPPLVVMLQEV